MHLNKFVRSELISVSRCLVRNLMARDELKNLGFAEPTKSDVSQQPTKPQSEPEKGEKGELRW